VNLLRVRHSYPTILLSLRWLPAHIHKRHRSNCYFCSLFHTGRVRTTLASTFDCLPHLSAARHHGLTCLGLEVRGLCSWSGTREYRASSRRVGQAMMSSVQCSANFAILSRCPLYLSQCSNCVGGRNFPLASLERVARRGSQREAEVHQDFLPSYGSRPFWTSRAKGSRATHRPLCLEHLGGTCASIPGHDGRPVGSLRRERQYRDRKASWRPVEETDRKERHGRS